MKKIIFVIALCILNLTVIIPRSFGFNVYNSIIKSYEYGISGSEIIKTIDYLYTIEIGLKSLNYVIIIITLILGIQLIINKDDEDESVEESPDIPVYNLSKEQ